MSLILDHINGIHTDNRLENLRIVCPNCGATLDTHCGKEFVPKYARHRYCSQICGTHSKPPRDPRPERRKVERPSYEQLMADVQSMSIVAVGRKYGVSDNAVRKWIRWYEYQEARLRYDEARAPESSDQDDRAA